MNSFVQLYICVRTLILVTLLKYGIRKNARAMWDNPQVFSNGCDLIVDCKLPEAKQNEVLDYLLLHMERTMK